MMSEWVTAHLLHVLGDRVLVQEHCALTCVETFCVSEELAFKVFFVDGERRAFGKGVLFIQAQLNCRRRGRGLVHFNIHFIEKGWRIPGLVCITTLGSTVQ